MRVIIDRGVCGRRYKGCETCLAHFLQNPTRAKRPCFTYVEDDHTDDLTIKLRTGGHEVTFVLDETARYEMAEEEWSHYAEVVYTRYRDLQAAAGE